MSSRGENNHAFYRSGRGKLNDHDPLDMTRKAISFNRGEIGMRRKPLPGSKFCNNCGEKL